MRPGDGRSGFVERWSGLLTAFGLGRLYGLTVVVYFDVAFLKQAQ